MSEEQNCGNNAPENLSEPPKRRRVPSQYATQIADFKTVSLNLSRTTPDSLKKIDPPEPYRFPNPSVCQSGRPREGL